VIELVGTIVLKMSILVACTVVVLLMSFMSLEILNMLIDYVPATIERQRKRKQSELWRAYWRPEAKVDLTTLGPREFVVSGGEKGGHYLFMPVSKRGRVSREP
jgi:hypothetical protein